MKHITSTDNPLIKHVVKLHHSKYRSEKQQYCAEGLRICSTILTAGHRLLNCFVTEKAHDLIASVVPESSVIVVPDSVMKKMSQSSTPSGILCTFSIPQPVSSITQPGLVLAQLNDPGNVGTLIRTAAALNKKTIVLVEGVDPWSFKVVQASAGTIALVSIIRCNWQQLLQLKGTFKLYALVVQTGAPCSTVDAPNALLVVGNEAQGIPSDWLTSCDTFITLPMPGNTESLNAGVAGSIAAYLIWQ